MRVRSAEVRTLRLPLVAPFRTAHGTQTERTVVLVRVAGTEGEGWGECVAQDDPFYASEFVDAAMIVLTRYALPALLDAGEVGADEAVARLGFLAGHRMAKAAVEMAVLDAELRASGASLADRLGGVRTQVDAGVAVGEQPSVDALLDAVEQYVAEGYRRVKLKIEPGYDVEPVQAVRERFGDELLLQVDANGSYALQDADHLARLDPFGLLMVEQPLAPDALADHAALARRLATPICLDESIGSAREAALALDLGACRIVNVKAGRVGGYLEARRVHDVCVARGAPVWCGGMLETGLGRAANAALASLPGFTLPGDLSASSRFWVRDVTTPIEVHDGRVDVPSGPGLGVELDLAFVDEVTVGRQVITRGRVRR